MTDGSGCRLRALLPQHMDDMTDELRRNLDDAVGRWDGGSVYAFLGSQTIDVIDDALDVDVLNTRRAPGVLRASLANSPTKTETPAGQDRVK